MTTHYVFEGTEVKMTGRIATKEIVAYGSRNSGNPKKEMTLYEITPASDEFDWKKWVPLEQLFVIK